ncbi:sugar transferase [uncultured Succiniclasticum sp.]|uniref:sugar transferase n=1 Tax=uncultured Succiniclasticum sp. TaxID=1500547 RepID=UPI0025E309CA|nr:sugar transferase [uncultured Succiniclasticum sp.]
MAGKKPDYIQQYDAVKKLKKTHKYAYLFAPLLLFLADYAAVLCAEGLSFSLRNYFIRNHGVLYISKFHFYVIAPVIYFVYLHLCDLYTHQMQFWRIIAGIFKANLYAILTGIFVMYAVQTAATTSRLYMGLLWIFGFFFIVLFRFIFKKIFARLHLFEEPVLLMGAGLTAEVLLKHIRSDIGLNYRFIGYLEDNTPNAVVAAQLPHLGKFADAVKVIRQTGVRKVLVMAPGLDQKHLQDIVYEIQPLVNSVAFIPDLGSMPLSNMEMECLIDGHVMMFNMRNNLRSRFNRVLKFVFDWCLTLVGTLCISPFLLLIGLWVYRDSPGPVIFKHRRVGKDGKEFYCYKFRSMCVDAEVKLKDLLEKDPEAKAEWEKDFKLKNDPRITKSGAFLRKTSLDELPQIFNVLKGEMSLVGPRPIIQEEVPRYGKYIEDYYMVRPGITGMWQTSGRSDIDYDERVQMDTWYVRNWSIWFDIVLLWRTFSVVLNKKGAY